MVPKLVLSSASGDDDLYVEGFFDDLCREIDGLVGGRGAALSTLAITPAGQSSWPTGVVRAIETADAFVALCSPRYFLNSACGRLWWLFERRLRHHEQQTGGRPAALIPLAWTLDAVMPAGLSLPLSRPSGRGLRQLVRLRGLREPYREALRAVATQVVAASEARLLSAVEPLPAFDDTPDAFAARAGGARIRFVVAAGTRQEMESVRADLSAYGVTREQWAPYRPAVGTPIAERARMVAAAHLFESEVGSIDEIVDSAAAAHRENEQVVVLVDAWAVHVGACERMLVELDRRGLAGAAVLVPMNFADPETAQNRRDLRFGLRRVLRNSAANPEVRLRSEITTADQFDIDLAGLIEEARNKSFRGGRIRQQLPGDSPGERPILRGP